MSRDRLHNTDALDSKIKEYAKRVIAEFRPLTQEEKDHVIALLKGGKR